MADFDGEELGVLNALRKGDLAPLAGFIRNGRQLHPITARVLADLIDGPATAIDYRLKSVRHPDLKRITDGWGHRSRESRRSLDVAMTVAANGGFETGCFESAVAVAMERHRLCRARVIAMWSRNRRLILFHCRRSALA